MLRNLCIKFNQNKIPQLIKFPKRQILRPAVHQRLLCTSLASHSTSGYIKETDVCTSLNSRCLDNDIEYIMPYKEKCVMSSDALKEALKKTFAMNAAEIEKIVKDEWIIKTSKTRYMLNAVKMVHSNGIRKQSIVDYPWILAIENKRLTQKLELLMNINGLKDINDFVAFLRLQLPRLRKIVANINNEKAYIPNGNRVYYIAEKIQLDPYVINKYLAKRLFILEIPWDMFYRNLNHMIVYNVEPLNILKDLWAFKYNPRAVENRLKRAVQAKKGKIMPWMVRCPESILQKSLQLTLAQQDVLDGKSQVAEYVAERLGYSVAEAQGIMNRHPQVNTVRVTKIKEVLDYLLNEAGFTNLDIAQTPRILCHSLETTKQRLDELKSHGCRPTSLVIVCRSKKQYEKFLQSWLEYNKMAQQSKKSAIQVDGGV